MEIKERGDRSNPLASANLFSRLFLCWLTPLLHLGHKRQLNENDMYNVLPEDRSESLGEDLQRQMDGRGSGGFIVEDETPHNQKNLPDLALLASGRSRGKSN
ncbi:hypothetical protein CHARACLAT_031665 [Characodon lateralis]|uniref:Uncharacterized protein n=1 Tax=Characodon lateralis TaxID=208331 RepID=A0ABU7EIH0_9TELE|nr:hypothetical protein [Characodon lateralis]